MAYLDWGGAREMVAVRAETLIPLPDAVSTTIAAGLSVTYGTAMHGLSDRGRLEPGETVVVTGAAGGAGQAAVEIAKLMGARVIAVASSSEKCAIAKAAGADEAIVFPGGDLKEWVRELTGGREPTSSTIASAARRPSPSFERSPGRGDFSSLASRRARFRSYRSTFCCSEARQYLVCSGAMRPVGRLLAIAPICFGFWIGSPRDASSLASMPPIPWTGSAKP